MDDLIKLLQRKQEMSKNKKVIMLYESKLDSVLSDFFTFGLLTMMFWLNQEFLSGAIPNWILFVMFIFGLAIKATKWVGATELTFTDKEGAIDAIEKFYGPKDD